MLQSLSLKGEAPTFQQSMYHILSNRRPHDISTPEFSTPCNFDRAAFSTPAFSASPPKRVAKCLGLPATEANEQDDGGIQLSITEVYLQFSLNLCNMFEKSVLHLKSDSVTFCKLYPIMSQLRDKLMDRLADRFFGAVATQILEGEDMPCSKKTATEKNFCDALQRGIDYLEK